MFQNSPLLQSVERVFDNDSGLAECLVPIFLLVGEVRSFFLLLFVRDVAIYQVVASFHIHLRIESVYCISQDTKILSYKLFSKFVLVPSSLIIVIQDGWDNQTMTPFSRVRIVQHRAVCFFFTEYSCLD